MLYYVDVGQLYLYRGRIKIHEVIAMNKKIRIAVPVSIFLILVLVFSYLSISSFALTSTSSEKSRGIEENVDQIPDSQLDFSVQLDVNSHIEEIDEYAHLLNNEGYYETGDSRYVLSDREREIVECAVMCEAGGEGKRGEMMVAQSILDGALRNNLDMFEMIRAYGIATTSHSKVSEEVKESVRLVFDEGQRVTMEKTDLWYNPAIVVSLWHEEQQYVTTVGSHRFFWMNNDL